MFVSGTLQKRPERSNVVQLVYIFRNSTELWILYHYKYMKVYLIEKKCTAKMEKYSRPARRGCILGERKSNTTNYFFLFIFLIRIIESKSNTFYYYYSLQRLVSTTQQRLRHYTLVPAKPQKGYLVERELNGHQALSHSTAWMSYII